MSSPPRVFAGWLLLQRVAIGAMAEVFRARKFGGGPLAADVALKRLLPGLAGDARGTLLYQREMEALRRIHHPSVVALIEVGEADGLPYAVMPWLGGANLRQLLRADISTPQRQIPLPLGPALQLAAQLADGLAAAHAAGVVHRDLSPTNVQIAEQGQVVLLDFGIARVAGLALTDRGDQLPGKRAYASPEQLRGEPVDARSDLYQLGLILAECLSDRPLERNATALAAGLDPQVGELLASLLEPDRARRPGNAAELAHQLRNCAQEAFGEADATEQASLWFRQRLQLVPPPPAETAWSAAELRGEEVTHPHLDPDATAVHMGDGA